MGNISKHQEFSRVFVHQKVLEGAKFSHLHLDVLLEGGNEKSLFGKRYSFGVLGHHLKAPLALGMSGQLNPEKFEVAFESHVNAVKKCFQLDEVDPADKKKLERLTTYIKDSRCYMNSIYITSDHSQEKIDLASTAFAYFYFDDVIDGSGIDGDLRNDPISGDVTCARLSYKELSSFFGSISKALSDNGKGQVDVVKKQRSVAKSNNFEKIKSANSMGKLEKYHTAYFEACLEKATEHGKLVGCSAEHFLLSWKDWLTFASLEYSREWHTMMSDGGKAKQVIPLLTQLRHKTVGGVILLEMVLLINGVNVDNEIRDSPLFQMIRSLVGTYYQKVQDFYSFDKEMRNGDEWRTNEGCLLHKLSGLTVDKAMAKLAKDANETLEQMEVLCSILIDSQNEIVMKQHVDKIIYHVKKCLLLSIQMGIFTNRYHKNLNIECYIEA